MSGLLSFLVAVGFGFFVKRALSLVEANAFRLPSTENALMTGSEDFEGVSFLLLLVLSHGSSGGEDGGLDAMMSSEKIALSLGIGVDDIFARGVDI